MRKLKLVLLAGSVFVLASCGTEAATTTEVPESTVVETTTETTTQIVRNFTPDPDYTSYQASIYGNIGDSLTAWKYYTGKGITIAVIDSGFDYDNQEFSYSDGTSKVSDLSCYIATNDGETTVTVGKENTVITDGESHGTMCAGLAASANNGVGITGMAPDAELLLIKVDKKPESFARAYKYAADNGAKVISISLGDYQNAKGGLGDIVYSAGTDISHAFDEATTYAHEKGVVICAAAGNSHSTELTYPAACPYVLGVGGLKANAKHQIWYAEGNGSNYNGDVRYVDVCAPAIRIYGPIDNNKYGTGWTGTSFSAPLVAGAAALYFEKNPEATPDDFEQKLAETCYDLSQTNTEDLGYGQLDVVKLLDIA